MTFRTTLLTLGALAMMTPAVANAGDNPSKFDNWKVETSTDYYVKKGAKAFKSGDYERSIAYSNKAIENGLSPKREAIAQSNLCAAHGAMHDTSAAAEACDKALELRPGYEPAEANRAGLRTLFAQK